MRTLGLFAVAGIALGSVIFYTKLENYPHLPVPEATPLVQVPTEREPPPAVPTTPPSPVRVPSPTSVPLHPQTMPTPSPKPGLAVKPPPQKSDLPPRVDRRTSRPAPQPTAAPPQEPAEPHDTGTTYAVPTVPSTESPRTHVIRNTPDFPEPAEPRKGPLRPPVPAEETPPSDIRIGGDISTVNAFSYKKLAERIDPGSRSEWINLREAPEAIRALLTEQYVIIDIDIDATGRARMANLVFARQRNGSAKDFIAARLREAVAKMKWRPAIDSNDQPTASKVRAKLLFHRD